MLTKRLPVTPGDPDTPNNAPIFTDGDSTSRIVVENTGSGVDIGSAVSATDADGNTLSYSLGGTDASSFSIDSTTGQLRTTASLDYETQSTYTVTLTVSDGSLTDSITVTINITDVDETPSNNSPVFDEGSSTSRTVVENTGSGVDIGTAVSATDTDGNTLSYSLGGTDASSFSIDSTTGQLRTTASPDYETQSTYTVTLTVSDGSLTDSITVTINITDVDETPSNNSPVFDEGSSTSRTVVENTGSGVDIGTAVSATDTDGNTLSYSLGGTDASSFSIDSTTGQLRTTASLDYETQSTYTVTLTVSDGSLTDSITVTINITDVDETPSNNSPVFDEGSSTSRTVVENTGSGVDIGSAVSAADADGNTLSYSLGGTDVSSFSIDSTSGQLRTSSSLNYETKTTYSVTVTASDGSLTDSITVTINVTDTNDAPIFIAGTSTTRSIAENTNAGVNIGSAISATDDEADTLTYSIGGTDAAAFTLISTSGQLQTSATLDYETKTSYTVTVSVSDGNGGSDSINVAINITDVDENRAPVFTEGTSATRSIAENAPTDTNIGSAISATDPDDNTLAYTLSGTDAASFSIDTATGQLKTSAALDFETKTIYTVTITVTDGSLTDTITVTINVTDLDETPSNSPPVFTEGNTATRSVAENTASNTNIGTPVAATDVDNNTLAYLLSGADAAAFSIDSGTGQLKTSAALNYEVKSSYSVTITVSDGTFTDTITVTINVTDANDAPIFTDGTTTTRSVAENTVASQNIGTAVAATDVDSGNTLTYTLGGTDASSFSINSATGQLRTSASLDYETKNAYSVTVTVSDGSLTDTINVTISVTDVDENRAPVFTDGNSTTRSVAENTGSGANIGTAVAATDADSDDTLSYSLGGTDASSFTINSTTGQLRTSAALDYETKASYTVIVSVSDGNGGTAFITVTINVTNVNENRAPVFTDGDSTARSVAENTGSGANIGTAVAATDADSDDTLSYSLGGTDASSFTINSTTGQLRTSAALDYETKASYTVIVSVSDGNGGTAFITVTINVTNVNENRAPVFTDGDSTARSVAENTGSGVNIGSAVGATDADSSDTLTYLLGGTDASSFSIDSTNGQLRTDAALDYETKNAYSVTVTVSDGSLTDTINVTINVTDVNENRAPVFSEGSTTTRSVTENTGSGVDIGSAVGATDADSDDTLSYSLGGTDASSFSINSTTGQLRTNAVLDYETKTSYTVIVSVSDGNGGSDSITVTINVTDVNENRAPVFTEGTSTTRSVAENTGNGVDIGSAVAATDADSDDTLTYTLGGTDASSFDIVSTSGQLQTRAALDYETKTSYTVTVSVSDGNSGTDSITVTINVTDVADTNNAPSFTDGTTATRSVSENTASGQNIGAAVAATDADSNTLTYTLGGTDAASFSIVSTSGKLQTSAALDYETKTSYSVTLTVSDGSLTDSINVTINVTDVNEAPVFTNNSFTYTIDMSTATVGDNIDDALTATDPDGDMLTFSVGGDDASYFSISSDNSNAIRSGQLQVTQALIDNTRINYSIKVIADDGEGGTAEISGTIDAFARTSEQTTNNRPVFTDGNSTTRSVAENTAAGVNIVNPVGATDADNDDTLTYTLSGTDAASFDIDSTTGQLKTKTALDYEIKTTYTVVVTATDDSGAASNNSATITVTINVTDVDEVPIDPPLSERTPQVRNAIVTAVSGVSDPADVTAEHLAAITSLDISLKSISSLALGDFSGLTSLTTLNLSFNSINDISSLAGLTSLTTLDLNNNSIGNISALAGLTNLTTLDLNNNSIGNISALAGLTNLTTLDLDDNSISDISALDGLTNLTWLDLADNSISDISALDGLTNLTWLDLADNSISDISPLAGLTNLRWLDLDDNSIIGISSLAGLTNLTELDLADNNIIDISALSGLTSLQYLYLNNNEIEIISALAGLTNLTWLDLQSNRIIVISALENLTNLAQLRLANNDIRVFGPLRRLKAAIEAIPVRILSLDITIPDDDIEITPEDQRTQQVQDAIVAAVPDVDSMDDVTAENLAAITSLSLQGTGITALKAGDFDGLTALTTLNLAQNNISDISSLSGLTTLTTLHLNNNGGLSDLLPLAGLINLTTLNLHNNEIESISSLSGLTSLTTLNLHNNEIESISSLSGLTTLTTLHLNNNDISDISSLSGLTSLTTLDLNTNVLSGLLPLAGLTNLTTLNLRGTNTNNISALAGLTNLTTLNLHFNFISDISPLAGLTNLTTLNLKTQFGGITEGMSALAGLTNLRWLDLSGNSIIDISALAGLTNLTTLDLRINRISDISALEDLTSLRTLYIDGSRNVISDYGPLRTLIAAIEADGGTLDLDITIPPVGGNAPTETSPPKMALLVNYPNPFNPETWIPYQLSKSADVTLTIYNMRGVVVRQLELGQKPAGAYLSRSRAIHWDGRNSIGEKVAAGVYFYTFTAGDFTATRKMLIRK